MTQKNRYAQLIEHVFLANHQEGDTRVNFERADLERAAEKIGVQLPKNLGDIIYSFRYRQAFPKAIVECAPAGKEWIIKGTGRSSYQFVTVAFTEVLPAGHLAKIKVPDATPGIINLYSLNDEQALLAKVRYNRLIDIFTGVTCYSLQSHLRTVVPDVGQVETDELYVGIDKQGTQYILPVQAKGGTDRLNVVQIDQDVQLCSYRFPNLVRRPIGAQFLDDNQIALFEFTEEDSEIRVVTEKHYELVPGDSAG